MKRKRLLPEANEGLKENESMRQFWLAVGVISATLFLLQLQLYQFAWDAPLFAPEVSLAPNEILLDDYQRNRVDFAAILPSSSPADSSSAPGAILTDEQVAQLMLSSPAPEKEKASHGQVQQQNDGEVDDEEVDKYLSSSNFLAAPASSSSSSSSSLRLVIHVFCWKRPKSQDRLFASLLRAHYLLHRVDLHIHLDGEYLSEVAHSVTQLVWPHGEKVIQARKGPPVGLPEHITSSWDPKSDREAAIFLEDDIEVSPWFFHYALWCSRYYEVRGKDDDQLIGFSLYTPRVDETSPTENPEAVLPWRPSEVFRPQDPRLFLSQIPCSWGAIYLGKHWRRFRQYYSHRKAHPKDFPEFLRLKTNTWEKSWKRFLVEYMALSGAYMMYPSFPGEASFSTNHYEVGVHSFAAWHEPVIPNTLREDADPRFTVPLIQDGAVLRELPFSTRGLLELAPPVVDSYHLPSNISELARTSELYRQQIEQELPGFPKFVDIIM